MNLTAAASLILGSGFLHALGVQAVDTPVTELADKYIITQTDVSNTAKMLLDIRDIRASFSDSSKQMMEDIYENGKNAIKYDQYGNDSGNRISLANLSTQVASSPKKNVLINQAFFNVHLYGLTDRKPERSSMYATFGDDFVEDAIRHSLDPDVVTEGIIALVVYPYMISKGYEALDDCDKFAIYEENGSFAEQDYENFFGETNRALDEMMALYVGAEQERASTSGYSFYAMAQRAASYFDTDLSTGDGSDYSSEAPVNKNMRELYEEATKYMSFSDACRPGSKTTAQLHSVVQRMVTQTQITFTQMLIHSIQQNDQGRIELYSTALIPQTVRCRPSSFDTLKTTFLDKQYSEYQGGGFWHETKQHDDALLSLQDSYACLGFTCEDVGAYQNDGLTVAKCADRPKLMPMAGYTPKTDVYSHAMIDLDVMEMQVLLKMGSYNAAKRIYENGHNSLFDEDPLKYRTLQHMATTTSRSIEALDSIYGPFKTAYDDADYADTVISQALDVTGPFRSFNDNQLYQIIILTLRYQVVYMYGMYECADAVKDCESGDIHDNPDVGHEVSSWDECASFYIGSLEGHEEHGSDSIRDGLLMYSVAKQISPKFGTTVQGGNTKIDSRINDRIMDAFYGGRAALDRQKCDEVKDIMETVFEYSLVPIIQSVIDVAYQVSLDDASDEDRAAADSVVRSILPVIEDLDQSAGDKLRKSLLIHGDDSGSLDASPKEIGETVTEAVFLSSKFNSISCRDVGKLENVDVCERVQPALMAQANSSANGKSFSKLFGIGTLIVAGFGAFLII